MVKRVQNEKIPFFIALGKGQNKILTLSSIRTRLIVCHHSSETKRFMLG
jgi:hypothetical protein